MKNKPVSIRFPLATIERIKAQADKERRNMSNFITNVVELYLKEKGIK